jgi:8-oxo-dGTP pyrophosphatase MutT (NUDIX family)
MNKGPWEVESSSRIYRDDFIDVNVDEVIGPDQSERRHATVKRKPGVAVLAINSDDRIYLTKQYRYATSKDSIEVVCGGIDEGTDPLTAAQKELQEEIGIQASEWSSLGIIDMDSSIILCPIHLYVAKGLTTGRPNQEGTEDIDYFTASFTEALHMVFESVITHAASCILIMKAHYQFYS